MTEPRSLADSDTLAAGAPPPRSDVDVQSLAASSVGPQRLAGRYEILSLLGVGGMGAVYRARDLELDEIVALKMLRRELLTDPSLLARFRQEVKLARRVTHQNVARTFDIGEHEGEKFLTMELVEGESLSALLARQGRMELGKVVDLASAICSGLAAAHAAGIVHRDLKPENVLLGKDGRVVLTDFGIARNSGSAEGSFVKTMGVPLGTPAYMAPEQVEGSKDIDARADIYALGAMLYELLTGERPWEGDSVYAVAAMRLVQPPPDPRAKYAQLPDAAARLTMRCMARNPADRFASAAEVASALAGLTLPASAAQLGDIPRSAGPVAPPVVLPSTPTHTPPGDKTVAVLPFRNGGPADDDYLADGLTDDLIDNLSMTKGLRVRSRGVVMALKGEGRDPRELGGSLGVQVVVEGSLRRAGDRLRVHARVISVLDGFQLWAKRFDCAATEVLAVGDEMVRAVSLALTVESGAPVREVAADPIAIDLYLRARHRYFQGGPDGTRAAIELFEQALARTPDNPTILSGYAMVLTRHFSFDETAEDSGGKGRHAAELALAAAPQLGEARVALATCLLAEGDHVGAAREARQALASSPGLSDAHDLCGRLLLEAGAIEQGMARARSALALEPRLSVSDWMLARAHLLGGDVAAARELFRKDHDPHAQPTSYWLNRARFALWLRDDAFGREWLPKLQAQGTAPAGALAMLSLLAGDDSNLEEALRFVELAASAPGRAARRRQFFCQIRAEIHGFRGEGALCLRAVLDADRAGLFDRSWLEGCPLLAEVRTDPAYLTAREEVRGRAQAVRNAFGVA